MFSKDGADSLTEEHSNSPWPPMQTPLQIELAVICTGKTQAELADEAGVSSSSIRRMITGRNVTMDTARAIIDTLGKYVDWIAPGEVAAAPTVQPKQNARDD